MATTSNLSSIIRYYAEKSGSPFIDLREFCTYIKKYAEHHVEEEAALVKYLGNPTNTVVAELQGLSEKHLVAILENNGKKTIISVSFLSVKYANVFKEMMTNSSIPFPIISDLPKQFPVHVLERKDASQYISSIIGKESSKGPGLYILEFSRDVPSMLLPECVPLKVLLDTAKHKIRKVLKKEEYHDYFLKKLRTTNPTKEITIRGFYEHFVDTENPQFENFSDGDDYYIWNQTLYYIRQDYEKIADRTTEDINILQAVQILEIHSTYLKEQFHDKKKREDALRELENQLAKAPYFFSMPQILKFQDQSGKFLYGQYSEDDMREFLQKMTTEGPQNELPPLLVFKVASGTRYYVYKKKVAQVIVRLCNEAHESIAKELEDKWYAKLMEYQKLPEMTNAAEFEVYLHEIVETNSPVLHALLTAGFITLLAYEKTDEEQEGFQLFANGHLMSYSELLMLKNSQIYANARSRLPFIYTIPILSWLIMLLKSKKKEEKKEKKPASKSIEDILNEDDGKKSSQNNKKEKITSRAKEISQDMIPEGSTVDRELDYLIKQWNKMLSKEAHDNLTADVNALIRDYTRRVMHTLSSGTFTRERIESLAKTLVNTPNMKRIKDDRPLTEYVTLYMLRLLSNS
ncbi:MAG: hypothetical protein IJ688_02565 [Treponema sp.]|nr:hypothetical protein [Treponema sp.]